MKNSSLNPFFILMMIPFFISCQQSVNLEQQKEAILAVLDTEGQAFAAKDKERLYGLFVQDALNTRLDYISREYQLMEGFEAIKSLYEQYWGNWTTEGNPRNLKENAIIRVSGNNAWVLCDNIWEWDTEAGTMRNANTQTTFLEKIKGAWKISFMSFMAKPAGENALVEIERLRNDLIRSLNENDVEGILATHTEETVMMVPNDRAYKGLDEIRAIQEARISQTAGYNAIGKVNIIETQVFPGIAYDRFELKIEMTSKSDQSQLTLYNQGIWIYHQQNDGSWKLARAVVTDYKP
jgi:ketosteroid isomerase-like protein